MPAAERPGDTRRDPVPLIVLALVLLALRVGVTAWERAHAPEPRESAFPGATIQPGP